MASEQSIKANNIVTLAEGENSSLSFGSADVKGMTVTDTGELVITLQSGDTLTITNFESLAQNGVTLSLADGSSLETKDLYEKLAKDMPAKAIETPADNAVVTYDLLPGRKYTFNFDRTGTEKIEHKDGALIITFDNNSKIILNGFEAAGLSDQAAEVNFNGEFLTLQEFAEALRLATLIDENMERPTEQQLAEAKTAQELAKIEPAANAEELAAIEPAAGETGAQGGGDAGGFGFQSSADIVALGAIDPIGPIDPTALAFTLPEFRDEVRGEEDRAPAGPNPPPRPGVEAQNERVFEDGSVTVTVLGTSNGGPNVQMTITISGIPTGWGVNPNGGVYNSTNGTVTYTLPTGTTNFAGGPTLSPPPNSDADIPVLTITATNTDTSTGLTSTVTGTISITTDAVADQPNIVANDDLGQEDEVLDVVVNTSVTDTDGSETITSITITGIPLDFTLSAGTQDPVTGTWTLTPAQLVGLKVTPPTDFVGIINAVATSTSTETNKSGGEFDTTNDSATKSDPFTLTWLPNPPTIDIDFPPGHEYDANNALVKEDRTVDIIINANLRSGHGPNEVLTVTVTGVPSDWEVFENGVGTYDAATGTWTVTLPPGTNLVNHALTFKPPAQSDVDLSGLTATSSAYVPATNTTLTDSEGFGIVVDAVADDPTVDATNASGNENISIIINIAGLLGADNDGSESITGYEISGVPLTGYSFNQGTNLGGGVWSFTPAQINGLAITAPANTHGSLTLTAKVLTVDTPSDNEFDTTDNTNSATDDFVVTWKPVVETPDILVNGGVDNAQVKEDGTVNVNIVANLGVGHSPNEVLTVTVTGINSTWGFSAPVGTYNAATGTWTVTLAPGTNLSTVMTFTPPANSDIDLSGLVATATAFEPASGTSASATDNFGIVVDAVADAPSVDATNSNGNENTAVAININGLLGVDTDGSESITGYEISGVPAGYSFNQGTDLGGGVWSFTPAQVAGLTMSAPANFYGSVSLTAKILTADTPSDSEYDTTDNTASATDPFTVTWKPVVDTPDILVNGGVDNAIVKEDGSVNVSIVANLGAGHSPAEVLTVTVTGINSTWGFSAPVGTYNAVTGTWTVTLAPGTNLSTVMTFTPPANSDLDLSGLVATATAFEPASGTSASATDNFGIITDAVFDQPSIDAHNVTGNENTAIAIDIDALLGADTDGSEAITGYQISGVPAGYSFNQGTDMGGGVWSFTPAQIGGLTMTAPASFNGTVTLNATVLTYDTPTDVEDDTSDNDAQASDPFTVTWKPVVETPDILVNGGVDNAQVKEDGTVNVNIVANLGVGHSPNEVLTVTVTGINSTWGFSAPVGTYNAATGTWTVTLAPGTNLSTVMTFTPPANSDIDLSGLVATATAFEPASGTSASATDNFGIVVDAVADAPSVDATNSNGNENTAVAININGLLGVDTDGSESITGYEISGVPAGYSFNQGTDLGGGVWSFTPAQVAGLTMSAPANFYGSVSLTAKILTADTPSDSEYDTTDNTASATDPFTVTWKPVVDTPDILVNGGVDNAIVKEDGSVNVSIVANLGAGHSPAEVLTVTVTGINSTWGFSAPVGTYNAVTGTWTVTLAPGTNLSTVMTFTPPANSDLDLSGLVATATAFEPASGTSASATDNFGIITDAVADAPTLGVTNAATEEGTTIPLTISTAVTDTDGSEIIESVTIAGVPATATLSAGVKDPVTGVWTLTPAQLPGLTITVPNGVIGTFNLTVTSTAFDQNTATTGANIEDTTVDNRASTTQTLTLTVRPDEVPVLGAPKTVEVDETNLAGAPSIGATSSVTANFGADTPGSFVVNGGFFSGTPLFSNGVAVVVAQSGNGYIGTANGATVFTLTLNTATGQFVYNQPGTLDHPDTANPDDAIALEFGFNAVDSEGDLSPNGVITVNVKDDGPVANNDVNSYQTNAGPATGNVVTGLNGGAGAADVASQDESSTVTQVRFGGTTVNVPETGTVTINGNYGALTLSADGSYSYTLFPGGPSGGVVTVDPHDFSETLTFPTITEGVAITGSTLNNLGVKAGDLTVTGNGSGSVTFVSEGAGYNNTLGMYTVAADGTLQSAHVLIKNGNAPGTGTASFAANAGETLGFFIIADGATVNGDYAGIDMNTGTIQFIYGYGTAGERPANINDNGADVKLVYTSGTGVETVLQGTVYHTTERGGSESLNADGSVRVVSGLASAGDDNTLRIGFEDLPALGDHDYEDIIFDVTYTATTVTPGHCPEDEFTYVLTDGDGDTDTATLLLDGICPPVDVTLEVGPAAGGDAQVKEDGSVFVPMTAVYTGGNGNEAMTLTLTGVPGTWGVNAPGWTATGVPGQYTITLAAGDRDFTGGVTLTPPANSDIDLTTLSVTVNVAGPDFNDNDSATDGVLVIVDAVADVPTIIAVDRVGVEGAQLNVTATAALTDLDGSELITGYQITGVPTGFTFTAGTNAGGGVWNFTTAQFAGLKINPPSSTYNGTVNLQVKVLTTENPVSDGEYQTNDNDNSAADTMTLTWTPVINPPSITVNNGVDDAQVKEDGFVDVAITANLGANAAPGEYLTVTVTGINSSWGFSAPVGTYNSAAGTWTVTLTAGQNLNTLMRFTPPANSDIDLNGLNATVVATDPATAQTASAADAFRIITDAVADVPTVTATDLTGAEGAQLSVTLNATLSDNDGSEIITGYQISGVPTGFTFTAGTNAGSGVWTFTPAQIVGLKVNPPSSTYNGTVNWEVKVLTTENPVSDGEYFTGDNNNSDTDTLTLAWTPVINPPSITVNNGVDQVIVKEDGFVDVAITANLGANAAPGEYLTVTVTGINSAWGFSAPVGTYNAGTGTWTVTLAAGTNLNTLMRFSPPANSDIDLNGLNATVVARDPATSQSATASDAFHIVTDAVIDTMTLTVANAAVVDGNAVALTINTNTGETADGSEAITKVTISGLPTGATLNKGTVSGGVWTLTKADLTGLTISVPNTAAEGDYNLTVTSYAQEVNLSGIEITTADNNAQLTKTLKLTVTDDDCPVANDDTVSLSASKTNTSVTNTVISNDTLSADNPNTISQITFGATTKTVTDAGVSIDGAHGKLVIKTDGSYTYTLNNPNEYGADKTESFTYRLRDADNDSDTAVLKINVTTPDLIVGKNVNDITGSTTDFHIGGGEGKIVGGAAGDILVGDIGGSFLQSVNKDYNIVLILDTSGSMGDENDPNSRMALLIDAVENLLSEFNEYEGGAIKVHIVPFNTNANTTGSFTVTTDSQLTAAISYLNTLEDNGFTNYEAAMQAAIRYLNGSQTQKPIAGAETLTYFISDGEPNRYLNNDGSVNNNNDANVSMNQVRGVTDSTNEIATLKGLSTVVGVGIDIGSTTLARLDEISTNGDALNIDDPAELSSALSALSPLNKLASTGDDTISGGDGNDIIFGDSVNTDVLAIAQGITGARPGDGWTIFDKLEAGEGANKAWNRTTTIEYIKDNLVQMGAESLDSTGAPRAGGNDTIDGGNGNDTIFGQNGNDAITGGAGDDWIDGGSGDDTVYGGANNDFIDGSEGNDTLYGEDGNDIMYGWTGNDTLLGGAGNDDLVGEGGADTLTGGTGADKFWYLNPETAANMDTIKDFSIGQGDQIELSELLDGHYDSTQDAINDFVFSRVSGGNTIISVDLTGSGNAANAVDIVKLEGLSTTLNDLVNSNSIVAT